LGYRHRPVGGGAAVDSKSIYVGTWGDMKPGEEVERRLQWCLRGGWKDSSFLEAPGDLGRVTYDPSVSGEHTEDSQAE